MAHVGAVQPVQTEVAAEPVPQKTESEIKTVNLEEPKVRLEPIKNPFEQPAPVSQPEPAQLAIPEYAHGKDHRWLVGQLQRVHTSQHQWKLRYAALDENEQWGGSMVLSPDAKLDEWKDGDMVYVEGEILNERPSLYLAGPLYRVRHIRPAQDAPPVVRNIEK